MTENGTLTVRYFAGAKAAAGRADEPIPAGRSLDAILTDLSTRTPALARVLTACSFLLDGTPHHRDDPTPLPPDTTLDVLPPFAGG
ncbi:MAG: MoaD/ThiS family protein [Mycobacteriales bacterium]